MKKSLFPLFLAAIACGCGSVKSDYSYQKGQEAFWNGSYEEAITYFNDAVESSPASARNHEQLAVTYEKTGNFMKAWEHARTAYSLDGHSQNVRNFIMKIYSEYAKTSHFEKKHPEAKTIIETLGIADTYLHDDKGNLKALYYGPLCLHIADGKLKSSEWLKQ